MKKKKILDPYDAELDEYEKDLEDNFHLQEPLPPKEKKRFISILVAAAKNYHEENTNVAIPNPDLAIIKNKARELGVPYDKFIIDTLKKAC